MNQPKVIIAHTIKGKGVSFMENKVEWHYKNPNETQRGEPVDDCVNRSTFASLHVFVCHLLSYVELYHSTHQRMFSCRS